MPRLRQFSAQAAVAIAILLHATAAIAGHAGWYFESFSWSALHTYFGHGTPKQKAAFLRQVDRVVAENKKEQYPAMDVSERKVALWRNFINDGVDYARLSPEEAYLADRILDSVFVGWREAGTEYLRVKGETTPDFIAPSSFQQALAHSTGSARELLQAFEYGRSYGQSQRRSKCPRDAPETKAWICFGTHVVLSPSECGILAAELERVLKLPAMADEKKYLQGFQRALARASSEGRGMYVGTTD